MWSQSSVKSIFILSFIVIFFNFICNVICKIMPILNCHIIFIFINIYTQNIYVCVCMYVGLNLTFWLHQRGREGELGSTHAYRKVLHSFKEHIVWHTIATTRIKSCSCQLNLILMEAKRNFSTKFLRRGFNSE